MAAKREKRDPHFWEALISILGLVLFISLAIVRYESDAHVPILLGVLVAEIWRLLEQRPVQVAIIKDMIAQIAIARGHIERGDTAAKGPHISKAIAIVDGLRVSLDGEVRFEGEKAALETNTDVYRLYAVGGLKLGSMIGVSVRAGMALGEDDAAKAEYSLAGQTVAVSANYQGYFIAGSVSLGF